jgi:hypothetical protein
MRSIVDEIFDDKAAIKAYMMGLAMECPLGGNPEDCPMHEVRRLDKKARSEWVFQLSDQQCSELYKNHRACFARKTDR